MMFNKRLINMVPEAQKYIIMKTLGNWISLIASIFLWFSVAGILESILYGLEISWISESIKIIVCLCIRFVLARECTDWTHKATAEVKVCLRGQIYDKLIKLGSGYTESIPTAEVVQLAGEGVEQLESYFGDYLPQFFYAMLAPITLFIVFVRISVVTAVVLLICVPLIPVAIVVVMKIAKRLLSKYWDQYAKLGDSFLENLQGLTTLKVYGADEDRHEVMNKEAEHFRIVTMKVLTMQLNSVIIMDFVSYGGTAIGSILSASQFIKGNITFAEAMAMILLASEFFLAMRRLGSYFHTAMNGMTSSERIFKFLDLPENNNGTETLTAGNVEISELGFSYNNEKKALSGINLEINRNTITAIVGKSGCGKSTFASIISGRKPNYEGSIMVNGIELNKADRNSIQKVITVVPTASYIFAGTVRDTLAEGKQDATDGQMFEALKKVNLMDFVLENEGLETEITERASNISGGQRQRLALARALLKDSPIYIFDEATSNIDAESEKTIMDAIEDLKKEHTVILISHRLANVVNADKIVFLDNGIVKETGNHDDLMKLGGLYAQMFNAQQELENLGGGVS